MTVNSVSSINFLFSKRPKCYFSNSTRDRLASVLHFMSEITSCNDTEETTGSDILLEAILEAEVATNAKQFFSQPENQLPSK